MTASACHSRLGMVVVGCVCALSAGTAQQLPTFKTEIRVLEVDVSVSDSDGRFVEGLTASDFQLFEDETPQAIISVTAVNVPATDEGERHAGTASEDAPEIFTPDAIGRVYVMILDSGPRDRVTEIGREFIQRFLGPTDLMAVVHVGAPALTQGLTGDREALLAALERYVGRADDGLTSFRAIREAALNLSAVSGRRKAILFLGAGTALWGGADVQRQRELWREYDDAVRTAARNNVRIYPIDPTGLRSAVEGIDLASETNPFAGRPTYWDGLKGDLQSSLRLMAEDTGGVAIVNTNNFAGNLRRVVRDQSRYYVLQYYSSTPRDGQFHRIAVRLPGRADVRVRARSGYVAGTPDVRGRAVSLPRGLSARAREALRSDTPVADLPLAMSSAVFRASGLEGSVLIETHVSGSGLHLDGGSQIELAYVATDRWGVVRAAHRRAFAMNLGGTTREQVRNAGLRLFGRVQLPRGRYRVTVAVHQPGGATGSAMTDVEVPDYTDLPLSVSDLIVASGHGPEFVALEEDAVLRRALPTQPTTSRRFRGSEVLTVFAEVYDGHWMLSRRIGVTATLLASDGRAVFRDEQLLGSANRERFYFTGRLPLAGLPPGNYVLSVEATTRGGVLASASRELRMEVVED
jgi:VWFA-related protein